MHRARTSDYSEFLNRVPAKAVARFPPWLRLNFNDLIAYSMPRYLVILLLFAASGALLAQGPAPAASAAADDYSGMYSFLRDGEFVQINVEDKGKVSGFISRYGDLESDRGAFLDQFIKQGSIDGHALNFTTETVHGAWYEFKGTAARGPGKTPNDEGYYLLKGTLTQHGSDATHDDTSKSREVVFKSFPQDVSAGPPTPKD
jgi:hypothetical protein